VQVISARRGVVIAVLPETEDWLPDVRDPIGWTVADGDVVGVTYASTLL
jgi:hypothetical protein